jgi:nitroimidazol reductase NimA-like FMN-containing flavoprotein (pyridoxamine 5'-phosphate oxidase superfamily)
MQGRMKQHPLSKEEIDNILKNEQVGRIATHNENGYPYIVPVHYVVFNEKIYIHGLIKGQKISNLIQNNKVGFEVDEMGAIIPDDENPCDTNTVFRSVIILGTAKMIEDMEIKKEILQTIVEKYTPQLSHLSFPEKMMKATGIIEIEPIETTGKYYK